MPPSIEKAVNEKAVNWLPWYDEALRLSAEGRDVRAISKLLGKSYNVIYRLRRSEVFSQKLLKIQHSVFKSIKETRLESIRSEEVKEARKLVNKAAVKAIQRIIWISEHGTPDDKIRLDASKDILDRAGLRAPVEIKQETTVTREYSPQEIIRAKEVMDEAAAVITRLSNKPSPFVLRESVLEGIASSETEKACDDVPAQEVTDLPLETSEGLLDEPGT